MYIMHRAGCVLVLMCIGLSVGNGAPMGIAQHAGVCADLASPHYCEMKKADGACVIPLILQRCQCTCRPNRWTGMLGNVMSKYLGNDFCKAYDGNKVECEKAAHCWYNLQNHVVACYPDDCGVLTPDLRRCAFNPRCVVNQNQCEFRACEEMQDQVSCTVNKQCIWDSSQNFCSNSIEQNRCEKNAGNRQRCDADMMCRWSQPNKWCVESECSRYAHNKASCDADARCTWSRSASWCKDANLASGAVVVGVESTASQSQPAPTASPTRLPSAVPTPAPTPHLPPCAMWGAYLAGNIIKDSCGMTSKGIVMPPIKRSDPGKSEYETYLAVDKLCKNCPSCKAWMYEPQKRTALLYSSISGQINPGNVFVAGLRYCSKPQSPKTVSRDVIMGLPKCVGKHTYLVGQTVTNAIGDPHCGTGTGVLPAATITEAYRACQFCGGCNAWMWSPQTSNVVMFSSVVNSLQRNNSYYFSAHKGSCVLPMN